MRVLHTSDWHIGRTFHGVDLLADQDAVLGAIADIVADDDVDVVLVAGDVYDRAVPSAEAVRVAGRAFRRIRDAGARLVVTPGNHDSAVRLGMFGEFTSGDGLYLRTTIDGLAEPVLLDDDHGSVAFYGIPYLEPDPARHAMGITERGHAGVLAEAMRRINVDRATRDARSVVLAHGFVTGGAGSDSERPIGVGGVEQVGAAVFDGPDYVALGHLHGPQTLSERLRYCGSPLAYSFSETSHRKCVWLVDLDADGLADVKQRELPVPRPLATVSGRLDDLLSDPVHDHLIECYLSVTLTDPVRPIDGMRALRERFPYAVHLEWVPPEGKGDALRYRDVVRGRSDAEITDNFFSACRGSELNPSERTVVDRALAAAARAEVGAE